MNRQRKNAPTLIGWGRSVLVLAGMAGVTVLAVLAVVIFVALLSAGVYLLVHVLGDFFTAIDPTESGGAD